MNHQLFPAARSTNHRTPGETTTVSTPTREDVETLVLSSLEELGAESDALNPTATFEDLDVDSLDLAELSQIVEEQYGVKLQGEDVAKLRTVEDAVNLITERAAQ
ncbi:acyl carrier protein [Patulibacter sp.]|uniref:acyl carrier protein n=1 Tax=Patulibacter sp. TaxID=1912859 RepID=UPI0027251E63|nr:acyl carrier protein [Patulibacter sp.]MDO9410607.1 acyl carrier protein [Patulibacter sp.]